MGYNYNEGLDAAKRAKLLMKYSLDKTLNENISEQTVLNEQVYVQNNDGTYDLKTGPYRGIEATKLFPSLKSTDYPKKLDKNKRPLGSPSLAPTVNLTPNQTQSFSDKWKSDYAKAHPDEVWDPNLTRDEQYWDSQGRIHTKKVKTGGFVPLTAENVGLRGTPFGFHPSEYPEYLKKVAEIKKKYPDENSVWYNPTTWFDDDTDEKRNQELAKLKKEYYHEEFPFGITKEDFKDWTKARATLNAEQAKEFDKITKEFSSKYKSPQDMPGSDYFLDVHNQNMKKLEMMRKSQVYGSFKSMDDYLNAIFEYDPIAYKEMNKGWLEKWWDKYGVVAEFIGWVILDIFSEGWLIPATEARQAYVLAKILKIAFRSGLPVAVGVARSLKEGHITENAVMDFVFAILPWAHSYFSIAKTPSVQLVESIVSKRKGLNLREVGDVRKYIKTLSEEEKYFFKKVAKLSQSELESALNKSLKEIDKIGKQVLKTTGKKIKPSMVKKVGTVLGRMAFIDLPAIEIANVLAKKLGFLDEADKIKRLEEEFKSKQGTDLLILIANATQTIKKYPNLSSDETIKKINQKGFAKTLETAIKILTDENLIDSLLVDENGKPFK